MHADAHPDAGLTIQCPVCRAMQAARHTCRRCTADLTLFVRVSESSQTARRRLDEAIANGDAVAQARLHAYLRWLHG